MKLNYKSISVFLLLLIFCQGRTLNNGREIEKDENIDGINLEKREALPELTNIECGENTKVCNIGFNKLRLSMYGVIWTIDTPKATVLETFRKKKKDKDEFVSMIANIRNFDTSFKVYITGKIKDGGCINDTDDKCKLDVFMHDINKKDIVDFYLDKIEDKTSKLIRFKYSDWTGKCYIVWDIKFDIQATEKDLVNWHYYNRVQFDK